MLVPLSAVSEITPSINLISHAVEFAGELRRYVVQGLPS